jgi:E3 ubiquitin-protein ligase makorin
MERPSTARPRGVCRFYPTARGCREGDRCKFLHGPDETLTPYDKAKTCKFFAAGACDMLCSTHVLCRFLIMRRT